MQKRGYLVVGLVVFLALVLGGIALLGGLSPQSREASVDDGITLVTGATGGGKENFLADPEIAAILRDEYGIRVQHIAWSNGKLTDQALAEDSAHAYDFVFFSDQRYYEQYQAANNKTYRKQKGFIALNTPVVFYSWKQVAETLEKQGAVTKRGDVYYLSDMGKLLSLIERQATWQSLCDDPASPVAANRNPVNVISVDPVTSSPGATYYGLLAAVLDSGNRTGGISAETLEKLQQYYKQSGFLTFTPADLFDQYLRIGMGSYPLIVDYEKSLIDWAIANPVGYEKVRDRIVTLYPEPTIWNSHCILSFTENGSIFLDALENNARIQEIAFQRYGFRMGLSAAYENTSAFQTAEGELTLPGIPGEILSVVPSLRMEGYDKIIAALKATVEPQ